MKNKILLKGSKSKGIMNAQKITFSFKRNMEDLLDKLDKMTGSGFAYSADEYSNKRETTADEVIDNTVSKTFYSRDVAISAVETKAALADLINYFQTTPVLNYGKYFEINI